jgi:hypothetical protein
MPLTMQYSGTAIIAKLHLDDEENENKLNHVSSMSCLSGFDLVMCVHDCVRACVCVIDMISNRSRNRKFVDKISSRQICSCI